MLCFSILLVCRRRDYTDCFRNTMGQICAGVSDSFVKFMAADSDEYDCADLSEYGKYKAYVSEPLLIYLVILLFSVLFPVSYGHFITGAFVKLGMLLLLFLAMLVITKQLKWFLIVLGKGKK